MSGGKGDDVQHGGNGNDTIYANQGVDESFGDDGNDHLWALARSDVAFLGDPVGDTLHGGNGNDTFHVRDGEVDKIDCGPGNDKVLADQFDVILDATAQNPNGSCETVTRKTVEKAPDSEAKENNEQNKSEDKATS
jgi:Ca2+-binding RTX toxin-like protein